MRHDTVCAFSLAVCALVTLQQAVADVGDDVTVMEVIEPTSGHRLKEADVVYPLAVLRTAGWEPARVEQAIQQVEDIFDQCGITVTAGSVYWLEAPVEFRELDESMQSRLLSELPSTRPVAVLVDRTADRDVAYSYLRSAPLASRGTAWITRHSHPRCLGTLLAHELAHILLDSDRHSGDRGNLMFHTCTISNIAGSGPGTDLTDSQCNSIRTR
jgi:hypothetical protein